MPTRVRVAALQLAVGDDLAANLAACLRLIDQAAAARPQIMVLPEFVNHLAWYHDADHCRQVAVTLDGPFVAAIAERARRHACYIKINVTLRREDGQVTGTNILLDPAGGIAAVNDKQVLMGNENNFLQPAGALAPVIDTPVGRLGMYACMDGVIPEVARSLAVRGAQVLLNSLNSFALDEAALHIPVRAAENRVFVAAANKVGPLIPEALRPAVAARLQIDPVWLEGAGESQIVAPNGAVLAKAPRRGEAVIWADIDPAQADDKRRPDGADLMAGRRPACYRPIAQPPADQGFPAAAPQAQAAVYQPAGRGTQAVAEALAALRQAEAAGVQLLALPELFHLETGGGTDVAAAAAASPALLTAVQDALSGSCLAALSVVEDGQHVGVLVGRRGVLLRQPQLHAIGRHAWARPGDGVAVADVGWARVALVVGNDTLFPEMFRLAALQGAEVAAALTTVLEPWENTLGFAERAAENRINLAAASPSGGGIYAVGEDFTLWTPWPNRPFDGRISAPEVTPAAGAGLTVGTIYPAAAHNKLVSHRTDLLAGRPWRLADPLVA